MPRLGGSPLTDKEIQRRVGEQIVTVAGDHGPAPWTSTNSTSGKRARNWSAGPG